jgi:hypothetical protein
MAAVGKRNNLSLPGIEPSSFSAQPCHSASRDDSEKVEKTLISFLQIITLTAWLALQEKYQRIYYEL